ncbi:MAG: hypothetical protein NTX28_00160, partial [Novosphingobium sp.]|nr:hypothetical protein [Novosphingobium sp.]
GLAVATLAAAITSTAAQAHAIWFAQRARQLALVYGVGLSRTVRRGTTFSVLLSCPQFRNRPAVLCSMMFARWRRTPMVVRGRTANRRVPE